MTKGRNKKMSKRKKIMIIVIIVLFAIIGVQAALMIVRGNGTSSKGNDDKFSVAGAETLNDSELADKTIIFLGSSVTDGSAAMGESFVDFMEKRDGINPVKEAVSGTTLVDKTLWGKQSYIARMKTIDTSIRADAFVCQLSTNDAFMRKPLGEVSENFDIDGFDTQTVAGAIEYVIAYAKTTWNCPVIFFTGTRYDSKQYGKMVDLLLVIQRKWDIGVIDLWNNAKLNAVTSDSYKLYMVNGIHPSRAGYLEWWTPVFESYLTNYLTK
jgi:lysophospholipase L1-like esterase